MRWPQVNCSAGKSTWECRQKSPQLMTACFFFRLMAENYLRSKVYYLKPLLFLSGSIFSNLWTFLLMQFWTIWPMQQLAAFEVKGKPSKMTLFQKSGLIIVIFIPIFKKVFSKKFFTIAEMVGNSLLSPLTSFKILEWKRNVKQK